MHIPVCRHALSCQSGESNIRMTEVPPTLFDEQAASCITWIDKPWFLDRRSDVIGINIDVVGMCREQGPLADVFYVLQPFRQWPAATAAAAAKAPASIPGVPPKPPTLDAAGPASKPAPSLAVQPQQPKLGDGAAQAKQEQPKQEQKPAKPTTRAERRAVQEAQKAAKAAAKVFDLPVPA